MLVDKTVGNPERGKERTVSASVRSKEKKEKDRVRKLQQRWMQIMIDSFSGRQKS